MSAPKAKPVDPNQNVSPVRSLHIDADNNVTAASIGVDGGVPLKLSLAASFLGHMYTKRGFMESYNEMAQDALTLAEALIVEYNKGVK